MSNDPLAGAVALNRLQGELIDALALLERCWMAGHKQGWPDGEVTNALLADVLTFLGRERCWMAGLKQGWPDGEVTNALLADVLTFLGKHGRVAPGGADGAAETVGESDPPRGLA